jgi:hypothetical protein
MHTMRRLLALVVLTATAACGSGHQDDAQVDSGLVDTTPIPGLAVVFDAPALGMPIGPVTITEAELSVRDLRVIGDANHYGVTAAALDLPGVVDVVDAPPGLYGALEFRLSSWELRGSVLIDQRPFELRISSDQTSPTIMLPLELPLDVGVRRLILVAVDLATVVNVVDWSTVPVEGDRIRLDDASSLAPSFTTGMLDAFAVTGIE